nr:hypothetical protein [Tanacetum cinerariifolium]
MEAKEKGAVLDAEAEAFLADVECTAPYDQPLAITTTNIFEVSHEDAYDSDVDEGPHAAAAFMANLSSISGTNGVTTSHVNEVHTDDNQIFDNVNHLLRHEMHQEEQLDSDVESDIDDNTIPHHQHVKVNQEQSIVNDSLRAELARCKLEIQTLERNKVKHDLDTTIVQRNKRNAKLEQENVLLKSNLSQKVQSINSLKTESKKVLSEKKDLEESKKVLSEKKDLEERYLEEIVCLKNANKVATEILQKFQQPIQTIPMLTKRPKLATHDLHKTALGSSNSWFAKQAKIAQPTLYDGHALLKPTNTSVRVHDSEESLVQAKKSNPPKPVTPFVHTRPAPSKVHTQLLKIKDCFPTFETIIKRRTTPTFYEQGEWRFVHTKKAFTEQVIPFYEHVKELVQSLDENLVKEVTEFMRIFDELDKEYEQCVLEKKKLQIEKKNFWIQNECLITDCIAKDICSIVLASDKDRPLSEELSSNCVRENSKS